MLSRHFSHHNGECRCEIKTYCFAFLIGVLVFLFQLYGSHVSGSVALLADTFHVLIDALGHLLAVATAYLVLKFPQLEKKSRSVAGGLSALLLLIASLFIGYEAFGRLWNPVEINSKLLVIYALGGALGNAIVLWLVHSRTDHSVTKAALLRHILVDLGQSMVVVISGAILLIQPYVLRNALYLIDPSLSLLLAALTLFLGIKTGLESWKLFKS